MALATLAVLVAASTSVQREGYALRFSTDAQRVVVADAPALDIQGEITLEAWVWADARTLQRTFCFILSKNYNRTAYEFVLHGVDGNELSGTGHRFRAPIPVAHWTHVAISRSARACRLVINGQLAGLTQVIGGVTANELPLWIGSSPFVGSPVAPTNWIGMVDEVRIWDVAKHERQIQKTMRQRLRGNEPHLRAYYPMDEGGGQLIRDASGNAPPGVLGEGSDADGADPEWVPGVPLEPAPGPRRRPGE